MQEKTRTKALAGVLAGTLVWFVAKPHEMITKPLREANGKFIAAESAYNNAQKKKAELLDAQFNLNQWKARSLPPDSQNAARVYRDWVTDLAEECGLGGPNFAVNPRGQTPMTDRKVGTISQGVAVKIEAEATLSQLTEFLYRFKKTDLTHRIKTLQIESDDIDGDPYLNVTMIAEGLAIQSVEPRIDLFNQSNLKAELDEQAESVTVVDIEKFPSTPGFLLKADDEVMEVTAVDREAGTLTVKRGVEGSEPESHKADARIEQIPVAKDMVGTSFADYEKFLAASPFVKPTPPRTYKPAIDTILKKQLIRGEELKFTVTTSDFDAAKGDAAFALGEDHPEGMKIDPKSGELSWQPDNEAELKDYKATVLVTQPGNPDVDLKRDFTVALIEQNNDPRITVPRDVLTAWLGRTVTVPLKIEDETPADRLEFELEGAEDAYIDSETNALNWQPGEDLEPGEYTVTVKVKDAGGKTAEASVRFNARDDAARYTKFTAAVGLNDRMEAMLYDQINKTKTRLKVGSTLSVADITGSVKEIDTKRIVVAMDNGDMLVELGEDIRTMHERFEKEQASKPKQEPVAETVRPSDDDGGTTAEGSKQPGGEEKK